MVRRGDRSGGIRERVVRLSPPLRPPDGLTGEVEEAADGSMAAVAGAAGAVG
jgi:hypothetical protein